MKFNWKNSFQGAGGGALGGAALGATVGSIVPGIGTGIGAGVGAAAGALAGGLGGGMDTPEEYKQIPLYSPEQQQAMQQLLQQGLQGFNPQAIGDAARYQFNTRTVPQLANQFSGLGDNQIYSAAFGQGYGSRKADLESQIAALNAQMAQQQLSFGLQPMFDTDYRPERPSQLTNFTNQLAPIAGQVGGAYLSNKYFGGQRGAKTAPFTGMPATQFIGQGRY
jgi:hypothetical protein